jgi:hypothetical protein
MPDDAPEVNPPKETEPLQEVVRRALLQVADLQDLEQKIKERIRTSQVQPPEEPPEIIS